MEPAANNSSDSPAAAAVTQAVANTLRMAFAPGFETPAAEAWTARLARSHYENFPVVSLLLPRHLRQDFCNVYAFCRVADDLGDELRSPALAATHLGSLKYRTRAAHAGRPAGALLVALHATIRRHDLPLDPLLDLIDAFEQDQWIARYDSYEQLLDYCRRSANPVGRLVLWMCGYRDVARQNLADNICTALQLTNFWQDVRRDIIERDRIYIPRESMQRFGVSEEQIRNGWCDDNYRRLLRFEVERTAVLFEKGDVLLPTLAPWVRRQVALYGRGGRAILDAIRGQDYDTLTRRPRLTRWGKSRLILGAIAGEVAAIFTGGRAA